MCNCINVVSIETWSCFGGTFEAIKMDHQASLLSCWMKHWIERTHTKTLRKSDKIFFNHFGHFWSLVDSPNERNSYSLTKKRKYNYCAKVNASKQKVVFFSCRKTHHFSQEKEQITGKLIAYIFFGHFYLFFFCWILQLFRKSLKKFLSLSWITYTLIKLKTLRYPKNTTNIYFPNSKQS